MYSHNYLNQSKQIWRNIGAESVSTRKISDIKIELKIINILILCKKFHTNFFYLRKCKLNYHNFGILK